MMIDQSKAYPLNLSLKGMRNYLHGTDIITALFELSGRAENISVQLHRMASYPLVAKWVNEKDLNKLRMSQQLCVLMVYTDINRTRRLIAVVEEEGHQITEQRPYDEKQVTKSARITGRQIDQEVPNTGSFIDRVVALNKALLNHTEGEQLWLFVRIDLLYAPVNPNHLSIVLTHVIGSRNYKSSISGDNKVLGNIIFSKREK